MGTRRRDPHHSQGQEVRSQQGLSRGRDVWTGLEEYASSKGRLWSEKVIKTEGSTQCFEDVLSAVGYGCRKLREKLRRSGGACGEGPGSHDGHLVCTLGVMNSQRRALRKGVMRPYWQSLWLSLASRWRRSCKGTIVEPGT